MKKTAFAECGIGTDQAAEIETKTLLLARVECENRPSNGTNELTERESTTLKASQSHWPQDAHQFIRELGKIQEKQGDVPTLHSILSCH